MDITEHLKSCENSLRDLFHYILSNKFGENWIDLCGVSSDRIQQWKDRQIEDERRFCHYEPRLIYYADFYDLKNILKKNWDKGLSQVFSKYKNYEVFLNLLNEFRNPDAHRRELLPYQKHLIVGISGKIRTDITRYFSMIDTSESYYPRIESVQDSVGNTWAMGKSEAFDKQKVLRPGEQVQFKVSGTDPKGEPISFGLHPMTTPHAVEWNSSGDFSFTVKESHVQNKLWVSLLLKSDREFHATREVGVGPVDAIVKFGYEVLPPRGKC